MLIGNRPPQTWVTSGADDGSAGAEGVPSAVADELDPRDAVEPGSFSCVVRGEFYRREGTVPRVE